MVRTVAKVSGMMCGMCESHINDVVRRAFEVEKVSSSRKKGETEIISKSGIDAQRLKKVISETGYDVGEITEEEYVKKGLFGR